MPDSMKGGSHWGFSWAGSPNALSSPCEEASANGRIYFCCVGGWGRAPGRWVLQVGPGSQMTWKGKFRLRKMPWCYPLVNKDSYWKWPFIVMLVYQMVKWGNYNSLQCFVPYDMLLPQWKISPALDALDFFSRRRGQPYLPWSAVKWDSLVILVIPPKLGISN